MVKKLFIGFIINFYRWVYSIKYGELVVVLKVLKEYNVFIYMFIYSWL